MTPRKSNVMQDKLLIDVLNVLKDYLFEGYVEDQDFKDPSFQEKALQVASVSSFLSGYVDGICSLTQVDRQKRQIVVDKMFKHGKSFTLNELRESEKIRSRLWSELNPS